MVVGLGCTKSTWSPDLLHTLAENREVVVFDNRGSGHSKDPEWSEHASLEGYANSVVDLVHALELEQPDILGWSMVRFPCQQHQLDTSASSYRKLEVKICCFH